MYLDQEKLVELLKKNGLITEDKAVEVVSFAKNSKLSLEEALIEKDIITDEQLGMLIADYYKIPFVTLSKLSIPDDIARIVPERVARKQKIVAFARDETGVKLAMADPSNKELTEMVSRKTGMNVVPYFATERDIYDVLRVYKKDLQKTFDSFIKDHLEKSGRIILNDAPVGKIVDAIINYGYHDNASDIHIEPQEKNSLVRFRIDGVLHDVLIFPKALHDQIVSRIKVLSRLRTDEHLAPQDGKMRLTVDVDDIDIRVSILPVSDGEKIVLRLLTSRLKLFSLIDLGMNETDLKKVNNAYGKSFGMILSTGPTGSGKTTSIYAILKILNTRDKNITTIEDPVEYRIKGVNQINVNTKTNLTFASGLRSILRQDPNIVFVGEIRDGETAGIAVNAALTGHLVLSTLHTNDAATTLPRLIDMKVEPFLVASTVNVIIGQRLVRKICEMCKASLEIDKNDLKKNLTEELIRKHFGANEKIRIYQGKGCKVCHDTGYAGRLGVFEVLEVSKEIKRLIVERTDSDVITKKAIEEGMTTMMEDGLDKVVKGLTTIEEIMRVTKVETL
jgi:type IV pilus assembly protein PilB